MKSKDNLMKKPDLKNILKVSKTLRVLYVEDNKDAREQTLKMLYNFFDDIVVAVDGKDGLQKYKENKIDLVISDISMPYMDGIEMSQKILEIDEKQYIMIVTAFNEIEKMKKLIDIGVKNYIHKPIELNSFTEAINKVVKAHIKQKEIEIDIERIRKLNHELDALVDSFDTYVIASRTDLKGIITYASEAYQTISGYKKEELIGKPHNIVRHPDMPKEAFKDMWATIKDEKLWQGEVKNKKKDGSSYWVKAFIAPYYDGDGKHIGYSAIREDITAKKEVEFLNYKLCDLLDNAGQGFLSFDKDLKCEKGFSHECLNIFQLEDIAGVSIADLLFKNSSSKKELFLTGITNILNSDNHISKELFLSLLPQEQIIGKKFVKIEYKILNNNRFMVILTDITETKKLESKIEYQNKIQKMIISIVANRNEFIQLKREFESFLLNLPVDIELIKRKLHTFKGIFAQKDMVYIVDAIHEVESKLSELKSIQNSSIEAYLHALYEANLQEVFNKDLNIVKSVLSDDFFEGNELLSIDLRAIDELENKLISMLEDTHIREEQIIALIDDVRKMKYIPLKKLLTPYISHVDNMSKKLDKYISQLEIVGDENVIVPSSFKELTGSLIHVFNNCIDHGIEDIDTRVKNGKNERGVISCNFEQISNTIILEIADDGAGIDTEKLTQNAIKKGMITKEESQTMSEDDKLNLIFAQSLSTKTDLSTISGRGVGMSAIKENLEKLNGKLHIENDFGKGVTFKFIVPLSTKTEERSDKFKKNIANKISDAILIQTKKYIGESIKLEIDEIKDSKEFISYGNCVEIEFNGSFSGSCLFTLSESVKNAIGAMMVPSGFSQEDMDQMNEELPSEMANIIIGLSLSELKDVDISTPRLLEQNKCQEIAKYVENSIGKIIKTEEGMLSFYMITKK
jgi:two-component system chemotaxis sensor kinase CheA